MLLVSNIITIYLAVVQQWEIGTVLFVYWGQSFANGIFFVFKIKLLKKPLSTEGVAIGGKLNSGAKVQKFLGNFFIYHFGGFLFMYLLFILIFFKPNFEEGIPIIGLFFLNHGFSYLYNKKELTHLSQVVWQFSMPYARNIPMHIIVAGAAIFAGGGVGTVVFFLCLKTLVDVIMHIVEHSFTRKKKTITMSVNL